MLHKSSHGDVLKEMKCAHAVCAVSRFVRSVPASSAVTGIIPHGFVNLHRLEKLKVAGNDIGAAVFSIPPVMLAVTPFVRDESLL